MLAILEVAALACCAIGLGAVVEPAAGDLAAPASRLVSGWACLALVAALAALGGAPVAPPLLAALAAGAAGFVWRGRRGMGPLLLAWALLAPLLLIAARSPATAFDDFMQWLPNIRTLAEHGRFPVGPLGDPTSDKPGYPPAIPLLAVPLHLLFATDLELPARLFTLLLAGGFALLLAEALAPRLGRAAGIALGVLAGVVADPFLDPRIALTSHADTSSGLVLAFPAAALAAGATRRWLVRAGAACVLLALLRETNAVLIAGLALGALAGGWRRALAAALPGAAAFGLWRLHLLAGAIPPALAPRALPAWDWGAPARVLRALVVDRLAGNRLAGAGVLALLGAVAVLARRRLPRLPLAIAAAVALLWLGFLGWAYMAVFAPIEVAGAASAWRYLSQLGPLLVLLLAQAVGAPARPARGRPLLAGLAATAALALPLALPGHWRLECRYPDVIAVRHLAAVLAARGLADARLTVVHPTDTDWYGLALDYDLHRRLRQTALAERLEAVDPASLAVDLRPLSRTMAGPAAIDLLGFRDGAWRAIDTVMVPPACPGA